jgi:hypothetical protein
MTMHEAHTRTWGGSTVAHRPALGGRVVAYKGDPHPPLVHGDDGSCRFAREDEYRGRDDWKPGLGDAHAWEGVSWRNSVDRCDGDGCGRVFLDCEDADVADFVCEQLEADARVEKYHAE